MTTTLDITAANIPASSPIPGFKTMLIGATGTGKTHALCTLADMGFEVFIIFTEPGHETIGKYYADKGLPVPPNIHWCYIAPSAADWSDMIDSAKKINTLPFKSLAELPDVNKRKYTEFIEILMALSNFKDQRTGVEYGPVDKMGTNAVIAVDSMSGLNIAAMNLVVGSKPVKGPADWQMAMDNLERLITRLCMMLPHFVLISHLEREKDEVTGGEQLMASTLGRKLAPKIPRYFSDVIHVKRTGTKFEWSTDTPNADLKARNVKISPTLPASFVPIAHQWQKNGGEFRKADGELVEIKF